MTYYYCENSDEIIDRLEAETSVGAFGEKTLEGFKDFIGVHFYRSEDLCWDSNDLRVGLYIDAYGGSLGEIKLPPSTFVDLIKKHYPKQKQLKLSEVYTSNNQELVKRIQHETSAFICTWRQEVFKYIGQEFLGTYLEMFNSHLEGPERTEISNSEYLELVKKEFPIRHTQLSDANADPEVQHISMGQESPLTSLQIPERIWNDNLGSGVPVELPSESPFFDKTRCSISIGFGEEIPTVSVPFGMVRYPILTGVEPSYRPTHDEILLLL